MKRKILKQHPLKLAGEAEKAYRTEKDLQLVVPELMDTPDGKILVLNVYVQAELGKGILEPQYRIFQTKEDYLTEYVQDGKWGTAVWDYIAAKSAGRQRIYCGDCYKVRLADPLDGKIITEYFGAKSRLDPIRLVCERQDEIREKKLKTRQQKIMEKIDGRMVNVQPYDEEFLKWAEEEVLHWSRYIFYKYAGRKYLKGVCTHCRQEVTLERGKTRHNRKGVCPLCHSPVIYIAEGRKPRDMSHWETVSKLDKVDGKILYREFEIHKCYYSVRPGDWEFQSTLGK